MKTSHCLALALVLSFEAVQAQNEIEDVRVETYYISDANDATDEIGGTLAPGSRTYRVFLDLGEGCSLVGLFGDTNHVFTVCSSAPFFNNLDRGRTYGHQINNGALDENTAALDSWISLGAASNQKYGVEKSADTDGSIIGGANNDGGSANIAGGLLVNVDPDAGLPLTSQDGLTPLNGGVVPPNGLYIQGSEPTRALGDSTLLSSFSSEDFIMGCSTPGVSGPTPENVVLIAQLTTTGDLCFELNAIIRRPDGATIRFVANDSILLEGEQGFSLLTYPPVCGCTDPAFLEYDPGAGCDDGSCSTEIIFGCMDTTACNFNAEANFNVTQLCCFGIDDCNGLDVSLVCPDVRVDEHPVVHPFVVAPNPIENGQIRFRASDLMVEHYQLMDLAGRRLLGGTPPDRSAGVIDVSMLPSGTYMLEVSLGSFREHRAIVIP